MYRNDSKQITPNLIASIMYSISSTVFQMYFPIV